MLKDTLLYLAQNQRMRDFVVQNPATRGVSRRFVAGETLEDAVQAVRILNQKGNPVALDFLGENVFQESEAREATQNYTAALNLIKQTGIDANISIKLTALGLDISQDLCEENLRSILDLAREYGIFVCIDMEASNYTEQTVAMALKAREQYEQVGTVIQSYLYRSKADIEKLIEHNVRVRIVKGAYKEPPSVAYQNKKDVDESYIEIMKMLLSRGNFSAIASHDENIINGARTYVRDHGISPASFEFQMLYGIRRDLQERLVREGYNVRVYVPYGSQWYPYLMRRMAERPANLIFVVSNSMRG
ncbi:proline dehydrogenase [Ktedonobacter sp. SOSP1-85]|uniref:proline dehydrogenase family protein n=1 Tax=Ktedonobacter sp. SOSP1-85 TaxID=2778367 RepID=UPI00191524B5|nr:proline dehydrogenase family protein [Ktedonobacter sp. SOSP1-85]GHO75514.1 proline dehydrogenase [Ktedonobacter sp. SOSP1-85]